MIHIVFHNSKVFVKVKQNNYCRQAWVCDRSLFSAWEISSLSSWWWNWGWWWRILPDSARSHNFCTFKTATQHQETSSNQKQVKLILNLVRFTLTNNWNVCFSSSEKENIVKYFLNLRWCFILCRSVSFFNFAKLFSFFNIVDSNKWKECRMGGIWEWNLSVMNLILISKGFSVVDHVKLNFHIKEVPVQRMVSWNLLLFSTLKEVLRGGEKW